MAGTLSSGRCGIPPHTIQRVERLLNADPPRSKAAIARELRISRATVYRIKDGTHFSQRDENAGAKRCVCGLKLFRFPCPRCGCDAPKKTARAS
jgi:hypothetical protein